ncbi:hypothetical protein QYE76_049401 [Lolium multiflorum]|uniref:Exostosin GT47 domain-containing protein n=1 Tax=Lolium multiflorum TaxID=4521 RepID=A0AAD8SMZ4_LOLMU|nr:hypothetical protein QYE76_049401 [Lolium multiflorum]
MDICLYIQHDLPPRFNADLARDCRRLSASTDMCKHVANDGFGPPIMGGGDGGSLPERGAYDTDQFMMGMIFHARMRQHECLTADPTVATAVYVPFYAGFDAAMNQDNSDLTVRDALPQDMADWLVWRPEWRAMGGRNHFMLVGGAVAWRWRDDYAVPVRTRRLPGAVSTVDGMSSACSRVVVDMGSVINRP